MAEIAKNTLLKIKKQGQIYDLFVKTNAKNVECVDADGNKTTLKAALTAIYEKLDNSAGADDEVLKAEVEALKEQVNSIIDNSDAEALNSLREIADWINNHEEKYEVLAKIVEGLPQDKTIVETIDESVAAAKDEVLAKLEEAVPTLENDNTGKVLVNRNGVTSWENLIELTEDIDVSSMKEGKLYCIILQDDPVEVTQDNILEVMAESDSIILTEDVTLPKGTTYNGTIDANGHTITLTEE